MRQSDCRSLQELLCLKQRGDLARLLDSCSTQIEQTKQYGSYWNAPLSSLIVLAPAAQYLLLTQLPTNDYHTIYQTVLELYPPHNDAPQIAKIVFRIAPSEDLATHRKRTEQIELAYSWRTRAITQHQTALSHHANNSFPESISANQEAIELAVKAISLIICRSYPLQHSLQPKDIAELLAAIPPHLAHLDFARLYLYGRFWQNFYTIAKYGFESLHTGSDRLLFAEESNLAHHHAKQCLITAEQIFATVPSKP